jgi:uncharacterized protein (TIGR00369 family)
MNDDTRALLAQFSPSPLIDKLGIEIVEISPERCVGTMPIDGNTQPMGLLHGGASAALAETLGSYASMAHAHPDGISVGVDLNITHHRAAKAGRVTGTAVAVHLGRTTTTHLIEIVDEDGRRVSSARLTSAIRSK